MDRSRKPRKVSPNTASPGQKRVLDPKMGEGVPQTSIGAASAHKDVGKGFQEMMDFEMTDALAEAKVATTVSSNLPVLL
jgi:hypothetical protein